MTATVATPPVVEHRTYCRFCIALCGLVVRTQGDTVVDVRGDREHPLSGGYTCPKGRAIGLQHHGADRLDHPEVNGRRVTWDEALDGLAATLRQVVDTSGPDAVGIYLGTASAFDAAGRRTVERLVSGLGSRSKYTAATVDTVCKPYVAELMCGHPGAVPALDREGATLVGFIGSNPAISHGHVNGFANPVAVLRDIRRRGGEIWVIDPRRTETARLADHHLAPLPGTDWAVVAHLVREILRDGADTEYLERFTHPEDVAALGDAVATFDAATVCRVTGLDPAPLEALVAAVRRHRRLAFQTGTGATMAAAANVTEWLLWALHVVTGSYDRPGGMWFNPGFLRQLDRRGSPARDGSPEPSARSRPEVPSRFGEHSCAVLADEIEAGNLRALIVAGGNPLTSLPEAERLRAALSRLDALVVLDIVRSDTARMATHLLPCTGPLERADLPHFIDSFQAAVTTQYTAAVVPPRAERRPAWWVAASLGERLGLALTPGGRPADECSDDDLLAPLANRSRRTFAELQAAPTGVVAEPSVFGWLEETVLAELPQGRWRLAPAPLLGQLADLSTAWDGARRPLLLSPRRQHHHLNSQLRDIRHGDGHRDQPTLLINPADALAHGVAAGELVEVTSPSGSLRLHVEVTESIRAGAASVTHGFLEGNVASLTSGRLGVDALTGMVQQCGIPLQLRRLPTTAPAGGDASAQPQMEDSR